MNSSRKTSALQAELALGYPPSPRNGKHPCLADELTDFKEFGQPSRLGTMSFRGEERSLRIPVFINEFWTARQRQANSLHEVSYRACFKPQLPRFFIERLTKEGEVVYDPFMGRGTTPVEAGLLGRVPFGNDINPLSVIMTRPRLKPPELAQVEKRLRQISLDDPADMPQDLLAFYHPETLRGISSLKNYFLKKRKAGSMDALDEWLALVALNRLTGHSNGFFSVYTMPPNQAVSVKSQKKINERRSQCPVARDVVKIILKKTRQLLGDVGPVTRETLARVSDQALFTTAQADNTPGIPSNSVSLVVTSPPFLNVVQYSTDNWLRCWFLGFDAKSVKLTVPRELAEWEAAMTLVFHELSRVLKPGGHVAFEVGEVHGGNTKLEESVLPCGVAAGLKPVLLLINDQKFTKTANCWGVDNMAKGTNTNRVVVFRKG